MPVPDAMNANAYYRSLVVDVVFPRVIARLSAVAGVWLRRQDGVAASQVHALDLASLSPVRTESVRFLNVVARAL